MREAHQDLVKKMGLTKVEATAPIAVINTGVLAK
jgi:hypothetical protein